ncbi:MAG: PLP-dependent aminotransferase family protein [Rhodospirillum sp.]|nr:PLP-dependent aminotransferase family protein [Rhodospirillum sp.]
MPKVTASRTRTTPETLRETTAWIPDLEEGRRPLHRAIAEALEAAIASGALPPGARLPPQRDLAWRLKVNLATVSRAYALARERGLVGGEVGRGTFVLGESASAGMAPWPPQTDGEGTADGPVDLANTHPAPVAGPAEVAAAARVLVEAGTGIFAYQPDTAARGHRAQAAHWLQDLGVPADTESVLLSTGALNGVLAALMALGRPGDVVLTEALTSPAFKGMAALLGLRLVGVPTDDQGLIPESLAEVLKREPGAKILLTVPDLHNPTGATLSAERRHAVITLAESKDLTIIEDAVYAPLPAKPLPALKALAPDRVVHVTSLSKIGLPGLRCGMVVPPPRRREAILAALRVSCWMAPPPLAAVAARWIEDGTVARLTEAQRVAVLSRRAIAAQALGSLTPSPVPPGAAFLWLRLPKGWRGDTFAHALRHRGVMVTPGEAFAVDQAHACQGVRLCLGAPSEARLESALREVRTLLSESPERLAVFL